MQQTPGGKEQSDKGKKEELGWEGLAREGRNAHGGTQRQMGRSIRDDAEGG